MSQTSPDHPTPENRPGEPNEGAEPAPLGYQAKIGVAVLVIAALAALFWPRGESSFEAPGGFLVDGTGRPVPLATRLAPVTLVHFWATWCPPCISEIPALQRLAEDFADEPNFDLVMIAVDDEPAKVRQFLGSLAPMALYDPKWEVANRYGTEKLPETYLVVGGQVIGVPSQATGGESMDVDIPITDLAERPDHRKPRWVGMTDWGSEKVRAELREVLVEHGS